MVAGCDKDTTLIFSPFATLFEIYYLEKCAIKKKIPLILFDKCIEKNVVLIYSTGFDIHLVFRNYAQGRIRQP